MRAKTKSPPRSEPVAGCLDCGSPDPLHNKGCSISAGAIRAGDIKPKSTGTWVQWGIRIIGEFDLCSAKYSHRLEAEVAMCRRRSTRYELVSVTVKPWLNKK